MNPVAIRLLNQQLIAPQFKTPTEVVSHMGAMQAQEYRMMRWAVEMRTTKPSHKAFKKAYPTMNISLALNPATLCCRQNIVTVPTTTVAFSSPSSPLTALSVATGRPSRLTARQRSFLRLAQKTSLRHGNHIWSIV